MTNHERRATRRKIKTALTKADHWLDITQLGVQAGALDGSDGSGDVREIVIANLEAAKLKLSLGVQKYIEDIDVAVKKLSG